MATQNVKILLRRGLREQLTSDILDTGELGFTTDTNQLFIGIDSAINEVQFDPFINAHAIIQSWLESDDCPETGLTVDEDLVIRNINDMPKFLAAMQFFNQHVVLNDDLGVSAGDTLYQRRYKFSDEKVDLSNPYKSDSYDTLNLIPGSVYRIADIGTVDNSTFEFIEGIERTTDNNINSIPEKKYKVGSLIKVSSNIKTRFDNEYNKEINKEELTLVTNQSEYELDFAKAFPTVGDNFFNEIRVTHYQNEGSNNYTAIVLKEDEDYTITTEIDEEVLINPLDTRKAKITFLDTIDIDKTEDRVEISYIKRVDWGSGILVRVESIDEVTNGEVLTVDVDTVLLNGQQDSTSRLLVSIAEGKPYFRQEEFTHANKYHFYGNTQSEIKDFTYTSNDFEVVDIDNDEIDDHFIIPFTSDIISEIEKISTTVFDMESIQSYINLSMKTANDSDYLSYEYKIEYVNGALCILVDIDEIEQSIDYDVKLEYPILKDTVLATDPGLFKYNKDSESWIKQNVTIIDSEPGKEYNDRINVSLPDENGLITPIFSDEHGDEGDVILVTSNDSLSYWEKYNDYWGLLGKRIEVSSRILLNASAYSHPIPDDIIDVYSDSHVSDWELTVTENMGYDNEFTYNLELGTHYTIDTTANTITFTTDYYDSDKFEDMVTLKYSYMEKDFQFSSKPPEQYQYVYNQGNSDEQLVIVEKLKTRYDNSELKDGDMYVYTDRDIFGGLKLNIFEWDTNNDNLYYNGDGLDARAGFEHNYVPIFSDDQVALDNLGATSLNYGRIKNYDVAIIDLRKRDYSSSRFWYPYDFAPDYYYFSNNPKAELNDADLAQAIEIKGSSTFSAAFLGRARRNVEVVTENTFNQLFADQHLSAEYSYSGMRPSLFRKIFNDNTGTFLKYNKYICTTFFIDYSLKQFNGTNTFIRVGQLRVINGVPHGIEKVKLSDENTEIWQDDGDMIVEDENNLEFSNIEFKAEIKNDNIEIKYLQSNEYISEISYTVKRWTT